MATVKKLKIISASKDLEKREPTYPVGNVNYYSHYYKQYKVSLKNFKK
jgi:hypothetical protein